MVIKNNKFGIDYQSTLREKLHLTQKYSEELA